MLSGFLRIVEYLVLEGICLGYIDGKMDCELYRVSGTLEHSAFSYCHVCIAGLLFGRAGVTECLLGMTRRNACTKRCPTRTGERRAPCSTTSLETPTTSEYRILLSC